MIGSGMVESLLDDMVGAMSVHESRVTLIDYITIILIFSIQFANGLGCHD